MISFKIGKTRVSMGRPRRMAHAPKSVKGRYDAAQTNAMNSNWWKNADSLSADEANNPQVRQILRDRCRYEDANNSYIRGIKNDHAHSVIGTGPRLEFLSGDPMVDDAVEQAFMDWSNGIKLPKKLRTMMKAAMVDGEAFLKETRNFNARSEVQLDFELVEAELCSSQNFSNTEKNIDGVILGDNNKPIAYTFLKEHPGGQDAFLNGFQDLVRLNADQVIHFFQMERSGQHRGITEFAPALEVGYKFRDFTLSTVDAARIASKHTGILHTSSAETFDDSDSESDADDEFSPFDNVPIENGMMLTLPEGYDMKQFKPEQPTANYKDFKQEGVKETGRSIGMPAVVSLGDASGANFASGRLDHLKYGKTVGIRQKDVEEDVLYAMFMKFFMEARLIDGLLPMEVVGPGYVPRFAWFFDGDGAIDPSKEATARTKNLESKSTTYAEVYGEKGRDWKKAFDQMAKEQAYAKQIGLELTEPEPAAQPQSPAQAGMVEEIIDELQEQS